MRTGFMAGTEIDLRMQDFRGNSALTLRALTIELLPRGISVTVAAHVRTVHDRIQLATMLRAAAEQVEKAPL